MQRQAMEVSVKELRDKADELEKELLEMNLSLGSSLLTKKCQVNIVNRFKTSDQWKFEK